MQKNSKWRLAPLVLAGLACAGAQAQSGSGFTVSGFATVGVVRTSNDGAHYVISGQPRGATSDASGEVDSKLGIQLSSKFNSMFSGTLQLLSKQNGDGNFRPEAEWAYVKAQLMPSTAVRLGRMGGPFFAVSDFRDVGYANTWLRPPQDVYGQVPVSHFDGADVLAQTNVALGTLSAQLFGGKAKSVVNRTKIDISSLVGFNVSLEMDNGLSLRIGHLKGKLSADAPSVDQLVATLRATPFASVGNEIDPHKRDASFSGVGLTWDEGEWLLITEYTQRRTDTYAPDTNGWYATLGRRFGKLTPYVTLSKLRTVDSNIHNTIPAAGAQLTQLKAIVDGLVYGQARNQETMALGARWDFYRNLALKAQYERIKPKGPSMFTRAVTGFGTSGETVNVYSVAVDMVF